MYFPLGDPEVPIGWLDAYAECGVDIVEFGWPAADPYLDGAEVRASMARALRDDPGAALGAAAHWRAQTPDGPRALLMTYCEAGHPGLGDEAFFRGLDGLLAVAPPGDPLKPRLEAQARRAGVALAIFTPLPLDEATIAAAQEAEIYTMLQAAAGVTGARATLDEANRERIARLRQAGVGGPILLGFGISDGAQARQAIRLGADGVVVGSTALRAARQGRRALEALIEELRNGLDG